MKSSIKHSIFGVSRLVNLHQAAFFMGGTFYMQQRQLERELAQLTGESLSLIRQRGFSLVLSEAQLFERELESTLPHTIDWDTTA